MRKLITAISILGLGVLGTAVPAGAINPNSGLSCTFSHGVQANVINLAVTGIPTSPGKFVEIVVTSNVAGDYPPTLLFEGQVGDLSNGFIDNTPSPVTYTASQVFTVDDKTGNGHGDGSGDQYKLVATNLCSATL